MQNETIATQLFAIIYHRTHARREEEEKLVQPPQRLDQCPQLVDIDTRMHSLGDLILLLWLEIEEALDEVAVNEAVRLVLLADLVLEGAVTEEGVVARALGEFGQLRLQADEQVDFRRGDEGEEIYGALDLIENCG